MATVWPSIVSVASRAGPTLAAIDTATVPVPFPLAPVVIVTQFAELVAVQGQSVPLVVRLNEAVVAAAPTFADDGDTLNVQPLAS